MSICKEFGKDKVVFITKQDYEKSQSSRIEIPDLPEDLKPRGLILPNGEINFNCPCLGGMASGPCAFEFQDAFSCFHYSTSEVKGQECVDKFLEMQNCVSQHPRLYPNENEAMKAEPDLDLMDQMDQMEQINDDNKPKSNES